MSQKIEFDLNWYCQNCESSHDCLNCEVMNLLIDSRYNILSTLDLKSSCEDNINTSSDLQDYIPFCWSCWNKMIKSTRKKWEKYWCSCRS